MAAPSAGCGTYLVPNLPAGEPIRSVTGQCLTWKVRGGQARGALARCLLRCADARESVLVDVALNVAKVLLHQLLRPVAVAFGDRSRDLLVEAGIDRLALVAMGVLAQP